MIVPFSNPACSSRQGVLYERNSFSASLDSFGMQRLFLSRNADNSAADAPRGWPRA
jgi:hypothetical protein